MTLEEIKDLVNKRVVTDVTFIEQYMKDNKLASTTYDELASLGIISHIVKDGSSLSEQTEQVETPVNTPVKELVTTTEEDEEPTPTETHTEEPVTTTEEDEEEIVVDEGEEDEE